MTARTWFPNLTPLTSRKPTGYSTQRRPPISAPPVRFFSDFQHVSGEFIKGVGPVETPVIGRGTVTVKFEFDRKTSHHKLQHTLFVPNAPNCLLSLSCFDETGRKVEFEKGVCWMKDRLNRVVGRGSKCQQLYLLTAKAITHQQE